MRPKPTPGELAQWFIASAHLNVDCKVVTLQGWSLTPRAPVAVAGHVGPKTAVNPSPNAANLWMACRAYPGTVMLEGTTLPEGCEMLENSGAPDLDAPQLVTHRNGRLCAAPLPSTASAPLRLEPTFHKHVGKNARAFKFM